MHGGHWECLYETAEWFASERLGSLIQETPLHRSLSWAEPCQIFEGRQVDGLHSFCDDQGDIRFMGLVFNSSETGENLFASAYPFAVNGVTHRIEISEINSLEYRTEGVIEGLTELGSRISFFDPLFFLNKDRYQVGQAYEFSMTGMAHFIEKPPTDEVLIQEGQFYEMAVEEGGVEAGSPLKISTAGMAAIFPRDDIGPAEYEFQGPMNNIRTTRFDGYPVHAMEVTVKRDVEGDQADFDITLYGAQKVVRSGLRLEEGGDLSGLLWLQGHLIGSL